MTQHYIKTAFRLLWLHKTQSILSVLGMAIGLVCFSIATYYALRMDDRYLAHPQYKQIAKFFSMKDPGTYKNTRLLGKEVNLIARNPVAGIKKVGFYSSGFVSMNFSFEKENENYLPFRYKYKYINKDFLDIFSCRSVTEKPLQVNTGEAVITESCARTVYGNENPVGKMLYFSQADNNPTPINYIKIAGVIQNLPPIDGDQSNIFIVTEALSAESDACAVALMQEGVNPETINKQLKSQIQELIPNTKTHPIIESYSTLLVDRKKLTIQGLTIFIASLVLIAGLINFLKFSINSFYNRTRELSLRKGLGARKRDLFCMLFSEIGILLFFTAILSYSMTELIIPILYTYIPEAFSNEDVFSINTTILFRQQITYLLVLLLVCAGISWIAVQRVNKLSIIKGIRSGGKGKHGIRNTMLGLQIFICFFFAAMTIGASLSYQYTENQRYYTLSPKECEQIWHLELTEAQLWGHEAEIIDHIRNLKYVTDILFDDYADFTTYKTPQEREFQGFIKRVPENYFSFINVPVDGTIPRNENEIVITRFLFNQLAKDSVQGSIQLGGKTYHVTGIIEDEPFAHRYKSTYTSSFFVLQGGGTPGDRAFFVKCIPGKEKEVKAEIIKIIQTYLPASIPFQIESQKQKLEYQNIGIRMMGNLFLALSFISMLITILGVYSAISLDTESRQKEMAIRKINGGSQKDIIRLFSSLYIKLLLITSVLALPSAFLLQNAMLGEAITPFMHNPFFWISVFLSVTCIIFATIAYRIWLISGINPAEIIKTE